MQQFITFKTPKDFGLLRTSAEHNIVTSILQQYKCKVPELYRVYQLLTFLILQHIGMLLVDNHTAETAALAVTDRQTVVIRNGV